MLVEVLARQSNTLDFQVMHRTTRSSTGRRMVEIVDGPQPREDMDWWRQTLQALTSEELAKCLGISERHSIACIEVIFTFCHNLEFRARGLIYCYVWRN